MEKRTKSSGRLLPASTCCSALPDSPPHPKYSGTATHSCRHSPDFVVGTQFYLASSSCNWIFFCFTGVFHRLLVFVYNRTAIQQSKPIENFPSSTNLATMMLLLFTAPWSTCEEQFAFNFFLFPGVWLRPSSALYLKKNIDTQIFFAFFRYHKTFTSQKTVPAR